MRWSAFICCDMSSKAKLCLLYHLICSNKFKEFPNNLISKTKNRVSSPATGFFFPQIFRLYPISIEVNRLFFLLLLINKYTCCRYNAFKQQKYALRKSSLERWISFICMSNCRKSVVIRRWLPHTHTHLSDSIELGSVRLRFEHSTKHLLGRTNFDFIYQLCLP